MATDRSDRSGLWESYGAGHTKNCKKYSIKTGHEKGKIPKTDVHRIVEPVNLSSESIVACPSLLDWNPFCNAICKSIYSTCMKREMVVGRGKANRDALVLLTLTNVIRRTRHFLHKNTTLLLHSGQIFTPSRRNLNKRTKILSGQPLGQRRGLQKSTLRLERTWDEEKKKTFFFSGEAFFFK